MITSPWYSCFFQPAEWSSLNIIQGPVLEPVTLADLKNTDYLRDVDIDAEAALFADLIKLAREIGEPQAGMKFMTQTWRAGFNCHVNVFRFPFGNLQAVNEVRVLQADGTENVQDPGLYSFTTGNNAVFWKRTDNSTSWTDTERRFNVFEIDFTVGWATAADVPQTVKTGMMKLISHLYYNREETIMMPPNVFGPVARYVF